MKRLLAHLVMAAVVLTLLVSTHKTASAHGSTVGEGLRLVGANPFKATTTLAFRINHPMRNVDLSVFDVSGRRVARILHGDMEPGDHRVAFTGNGLPVGTYMARLTTEHGTTVRRLILEH